MNVDDIVKKMKKINHDLIFGAQKEAPTEVKKATDYLNKKEKERSDILNAPKLNGSTQKIAVDVAASLRPLAQAYKKARDDSDNLLRVGDKQRAKMVKEQYMSDVFLPTLESLVVTNSPEELLNSVKSLEALDKYVLIDGGSGSGYTASFIRNLHADDFGGVLPTSDSNVSRGVSEITRLVACDQIRSAIGLAAKIKSKIDDGEYTASDEDYEIIQKVALRG